MNERQERAADAVRAVFRADVADAVLGDTEAFGALAWNLAQAEEDGLDAEELLGEIDPDDVAWCVNADAPAGFIANRVKRLRNGY